MKALVPTVIAISFVAGPHVHAQELQSIQATQTAPQQGRVILDSDSNETASLDTQNSDENTKGNTEMKFKVEEGEKADGDPDRPIITGELPNMNENRGIEHEDIGAPSQQSKPGDTGGTEDISTGVGELGEVQHDETDLDFLRERASAVSVSAVEVRGWDPKKKEAFLKTVKEYTDIRSGEDLKLFAQGALIEHTELDSIDTTENSISMRYRVPAKFLGIFNTTLAQETVITFGDGKHGRAKVKFPWIRFLYTVDDRLSAENLERSLQPEIDDEVLVGFENGPTSETQAAIINKVISAITG